MRSAISAAGLAIAAILLLVANAPSAFADELDAAKTAGHVGERADGYLGVVSTSAPASAKALVDAVNAKRRAKYAEIAKQNGTAVEAVAALMGEKLIDRAPAGQYVMGADGHWTKK
jgi:uncharacterized protein YdbL (DUF1318 family)